MESNELLKALESLKKELMSVKSASEQVEKVVNAQKQFAKGSEVQMEALQRSIGAVTQLASKLEAVGAMVQDEYLPALERIAKTHLSEAGQKVMAASESLKHTEVEVANLVQTQTQLIKQTQESSFAKRLDALEQLVSAGQKQIGEQLQQSAKAQESSFGERQDALETLVSAGQKQTGEQLQRQMRESSQAQTALEQLVSASQAQTVDLINRELGAIKQTIGWLQVIGVIVIVVLLLSILIR